MANDAILTYSNKHYELRFPRLVKIYRPSERSWTDSVTLEDVHIIAREAVGRDRTSKGMDDWTKELWGQQASPGVKCLRKRKSKVDEWIDKLEAVDSVKTKRTRLFEPKPTEIRVSNQQDSRTALGTKALGPLLNVTSLLPTPPASSSPAQLPPPHTPRHGRKRSNPTSPLTVQARYAGPSASSPLRNVWSGAKSDLSSGSDEGTPTPLFCLAESSSPKLSPPVGIADTCAKPVRSFLEDKFVCISLRINYSNKLVELLQS